MRFLATDGKIIALQKETLKIALYHGYELSGSGSNEYTRYLTRTLCQLGHGVSLICREPEPAAHAFIGRALSYTASGEPSESFRREITEGAQVTLHRLPETSCYPVYLKDKQRPGRVKAFPEMTDAELGEYHAAMSATLARASRRRLPGLRADLSRPERPCSRGHRRLAGRSHLSGVRAQGRQVHDGLRNTHAGVRRHRRLRGLRPFL